MPPTCTDILTQTPQGLYCPIGDFYLDPLRPVPRALVTHGHSGYARGGRGEGLGTVQELRDEEIRYGSDLSGARHATRLGKRLGLDDVDGGAVPAGR